MNFYLIMIPTFCFSIIIVATFTTCDVSTYTVRVCNSYLVFMLEQVLSRLRTNPYKAISLVTPMSVILRQFSARNSIENYHNLVTKFGRVKPNIKQPTQNFNDLILDETFVYLQGFSFQRQISLIDCVINTETITRMRIKQQ